MNRDPIPRWVYRLRSLQRAHDRLAEADRLADERPLSDLEREGFVQRFEFTIELAWKTCYDYLRDRGTTFDEVTPRRVIRTAVGAGLLEDGQTWIDAIVARNRVSHIYDEANFMRTVEAIRARYLPAITRLLTRLSRQAREDGFA